VLLPVVVLAHVPAVVVVLVPAVVVVLVPTVVVVLVPAVVAVPVPIAPPVPTFKLDRAPHPASTSFPTTSPHRHHLRLPLDTPGGYNLA
jgi:hypothetical protein